MIVKHTKQYNREEITELVQQEVKKAVEWGVLKIVDEDDPYMYCDDFYYASSPLAEMLGITHATVKDDYNEGKWVITQILKDAKISINDLTFGLVCIHPHWNTRELLIDVTKQRFDMTIPQFIEWAVEYSAAHQNYYLTGDMPV